MRPLHAHWVSLPFSVLLAASLSTADAASRAPAAARAPTATQELGDMRAPGSAAVTVAHDVPGIVEAQLDPAYWIARLSQPDRVLLDAGQVTAQNTRMRATDPALHAIEALPATLDAAQVRAWIQALSVMPTRTLYDADGKQGSSRSLDRLVANLALKSIPQTQVTRYGMVVRRADLRTFPTRLRVFHTPDDHDIDRFQESALFPGTPVVIAHESRDRGWYFVVSETYAAWIEKDAVAQGERGPIFAHGRRSPYLVVTGASARTTFTPEAPGVSAVQLEMGVRVPLRTDWPAGATVNGQHPFASHVIDLPVRAADGSLAFRPALLRRSEDVTRGHLPLTRANLLRQSFKFLGERYGWGHGYNARDCSGFVGEVLRSFGVLLPRNTGDQATSPALDRIAFMAGDSHAQRLQRLRETQVGDLVYIPGHVMMIIGHVAGAPYAIHDTSGMTVRRDDGRLQRLPLNGVVVTPILPMLTDDGTPIVDRITSIQRLRR